MKKTLKWIGIVVGVLIVLLLLGLTFFGGAMIKGTVNGLGPTLLGVPVTLEKATFRPLAGKIKLTNLHVGNPDGFKTPALFDVGEVDIELDPKSLFTGTIVIHKIVVVAPHITYERGLFDSNFGALTKLLEGDSKKKSDKKSSDKKDDEGGKKVTIDYLIITDPALNMSITAAGGHAIPIKLGKVELKDIGKETGGITFADTIKIIFSVITSNIENAVSGAGDLVGSGAKAIGSGASSLIKGVGGLFGAGGDKDAEATEKPADAPTDEKPAE